jgi:DNA-binding LacI/PurR family transcriptional regulator
MNHHPLHVDAHYAEETTQFGKNVVVGNYVNSILLGPSSEELGLRRGTTDQRFRRGTQRLLHFLPEGARSRLRAPRMLGDISIDAGRLAAAELLSGQLPEAVVCGADVIALGQLSGPTVAGVTFPATSVSPASTTPRTHPSSRRRSRPSHSPRRTSPESVNLLMDRMSDQITSAPRKHQFQPTLVRMASA